MTEAQIGAVVLKDAAGDYFLIPMEALERGRVPSEYRAEVERLIAAQGGATGDDTGGYIFPLIYIAAFSVGVAAGIAGAPLPDIPTMTNAQLLEQVSGRKFPPRP